MKSKQEKFFYSYRYFPLVILPPKKSVYDTTYLIVAYMSMNQQKFCNS